jgi:hypothetical protein
MSAVRDYLFTKEDTMDIIKVMDKGWISIPMKSSTVINIMA